MTDLWNMNMYELQMRLTMLQVKHAKLLADVRNLYEEANLYAHPPARQRQHKTLGVRSGKTKTPRRDAFEIGMQMTFETVAKSLGDILRSSSDGYADAINVAKPPV